MPEKCQGGTQQHIRDLLRHQGELTQAINGLLVTLGLPVVEPPPSVAVCDDRPLKRARAEDGRVGTLALVAPRDLTASQYRLWDTILPQSALLPGQNLETPGPASDVAAMHDVYHPGTCLYSTRYDRSGE